MKSLFLFVSLVSTAMAADLSLPNKGNGNPKLDTDTARIIKNSKNPPMPAKKEMVSGVCTDQHGMKFKEGQTGFDQCQVDFNRETSRNVRGPKGPTPVTPGQTGTKLEFNLNQGNQ